MKYILILLLLVSAFGLIDSLVARPHHVRGIVANDLVLKTKATDQDELSRNALRVEQRMILLFRPAVVLFSINTLLCLSALVWIAVKPSAAVRSEVVSNRP